MNDKSIYVRNTRDKFVVSVFWCDGDGEDESTDFEVDGIGDWHWDYGDIPGGDIPQDVLDMLNMMMIHHRNFAPLKWIQSITYEMNADDLVFKPLWEWLENVEE